jgi:hypothetical protein
MRQAAENVLLIGAIPGPSAPSDLNVFLQPLVDELNSLWLNSVRIVDAVDQRSHQMRVKLLISIADTPGSELSPSKPDKLRRHIEIASASLHRRQESLLVVLVCGKLRALSFSHLLLRESMIRRRPKQFITITVACCHSITLFARIHHSGHPN